MITKMVDINGICKTAGDRPADPHWNISQSVCFLRVRPITTHNSLPINGLIDET